MKTKKTWVVTGVISLLIAIGLGFYYYDNPRIITFLITVQGKIKSGLSKDKPKVISDILLNHGDYVHPKFSPDGKLLAYSRVILEKSRDGNNTEYTEVLIMDLTTGKIKKLLDPEASKKYAVYKAYVSDLEWKNNRECIVTVSDGDVGASILTIDSLKQKVINTEYVDGGIDSELPPSK
jgi:Tol biopolymer transport system component